MTRELLAAFRWRDALDIALVAVVVYRGLLMFQGTRTVQMLAGVGVLAAVWVLARHLELWGITWLLDTFWSFGALALVVVFVGLGGRLVYLQVVKAAYFGELSQQNRLRILPLDGHSREG